MDPARDHHTRPGPGPFGFFNELIEKLNHLICKHNLARTRARSVKNSPQTCRIDLFVFLDCQRTSGDTLWFTKDVAFVLFSKFSSVRGINIVVGLSAVRRGVGAEDG